MILLCGGTGMLGERIAWRLADRGLGVATGSAVLRRFKPALASIMLVLVVLLTGLGLIILAG